MKVVENYKGEESFDRPVALTIGNFDGVHLGHQHLINSIREKLNEDDFLAVMTFVPHPLEILGPLDGFLLNSYSDRRELFEGKGVDYLFEVKFSRDFSTLTPEDFLNKYVLSSKNIKKLFLGYDFSFGANKAGNFDFAKKYLECKGIEVHMLDPSHELNPPSSTIIRNYLVSGDIEKANELLGRPFYLSGRIVKGAGRGKLIGFPTANLEVEKNRLIPKNGVYSSFVTRSGQRLKSITNVGFNPTFTDKKIKQVETFIFDFNDDLYGENLKVELISKIRDEKKFSSASELVAQIASDVKAREKMND